MICQDCKQRESSVHLTQIVNNEKVTLNLCRECAEKRGFQSPFEHVPFPLAEFVSGMVGGKALAQKGGKKPIAFKKCPSCGLTFEGFGKAGRLGCGHCYRAFRTELTDLLRRIHGSHEHRGKIPPSATKALEPVYEERRLREELRKAIENEEFEKAAALRDKIKELAG